MAADGDTTLTLFHHIGEETARQTLENLIEAFQEESGITVEEQGIDFSQYDTMLKTKLAGGDAPDLSWDVRKCMQILFVQDM